MSALTDLLLRYFLQIYLQFEKSPSSLRRQYRKLHTVICKFMKETRGTERRLAPPYMRWRYYTAPVAILEVGVGDTIR
jgi:hypothetical protein